MDMQQVRLSTGEAIGGCDSHLNTQTMLLNKIFGMKFTTVFKTEYRFKETRESYYRSFMINHDSVLNDYTL